MVCLDGSGNNNTFSPLANLYSVIPSAEVIFSGMGRLAVMAGVVFVGAAFCWPKAAEMISAKNIPERMIFFIFVDF